MLTPSDDGSQRKEVEEETITAAAASTTAFKRGTRTTGAGASKRHNPSIFSSSTKGAKSETSY